MKKNINQRKNKELDLEHVKFGFKILLNITFIILFSFFSTLEWYWGFVILGIGLFLLVKAIIEEKTEEEPIEKLFSLLFIPIILMGMIVFLYLKIIIKGCREIWM